MKVPNKGRRIMKQGLFLTMVCVAGLAAQAFEGRIEAVQVRGDQSQQFTWTVGTNMLCVVRNGTDRPEIKNLVALDTGEVTLVFPNNRSYMRYRPANSSQAPAGFPEMPFPPGGLPPGIGPQSSASGLMGAKAAPGRIGPSGLSGVPKMAVDMKIKMPEMDAGLPAGIGPQASSSPGLASPPDLSGMPTLPEMPAMPMGGARHSLRRGEVEFTDTGETTNLLGRACTRCVIRDRRQTMEVWATDQLVPFHAWRSSIPLRNFTGRRRVEDCWGEMLRDRKLFPLLVTVKNAQGEPMRFEYRVTSITSEKCEDDFLFRPPADYLEMHPPHV